MVKNEVGIFYQLRIAWEIIKEMKLTYDLRSFDVISGTPV
jgi:hypothetical protein